MTLMGAGAGLAMPAAIAALMSAVPEEHAGVGSALNDTIQQAGAAFGVAVLGAVLSSTYTSQMPASAPEAARESIGDGLAVAARTKDTGLLDSVLDAFTGAVSSSFTVGAAGVVGAALLALFLMKGAGKGEAPSAAEEKVPEVVGVH